MDDSNLSPAKQIETLGVAGYAHKKKVIQGLRMAQKLICDKEGPILFMAGWECGAAQQLAFMGVGTSFGERTCETTRAIMKHALWHQERSEG